MTITSCICIVDYDWEPTDFYHAEDVRARKPHKCTECGRTIRPGEIYERATGKYSDGGIWHVKTCTSCVRIRDSIFTCGFIHGDLWGEIHARLCGDVDGELVCVCPETARTENHG